MKPPLRSVLVYSSNLAKQSPPTEKYLLFKFIACGLPSENPFVIISSVEPIKPYIRGGSRIFLGGGAPLTTIFTAFNINSLALPHVLLQHQ